jgi:hypothetical protein
MLHGLYCPGTMTAIVWVELLYLDSYQVLHLVGGHVVAPTHNLRWCGMSDWRLAGWYMACCEAPVFCDSADAC